MKSRGWRFEVGGSRWETPEKKARPGGRAFCVKEILNPDFWILPALHLVLVLAAGLRARLLLGRRLGSLCMWG